MFILDAGASGVGSGIGPQAKRVKGVQLPAGDARNTGDAGNVKADGDKFVQAKGQGNVEVKQPSMGQLIQQIATLTTEIAKAAEQNDQATMDKKKAELKLVQEQLKDQLKLIYQLGELARTQ